MKIFDLLFANHKKKILDVDRVVNESEVNQKNIQLSKQLQKSIKAMSSMKIQAEKARKHLDSVIAIAIINAGGRID